jgi:hypothetical protein
MKITKSLLKEIIKEELSEVAPPRGQSAVGSVAHFDNETGKPLTAKGWEMAAKNPQHPFHKAAQEKVGQGGRVAVSDKGMRQQQFKNIQATYRDLHVGLRSVKAGIKKAADSLKSAEQMKLQGVDDIRKELAGLNKALEEVEFKFASYGKAWRQ